MPPMQDFAYHRAYLLSLWREAPDAPWRAALRLAGSEERLGFANLEALALFLIRLDEGDARLAADTEKPEQER
jgi:hypothetical protein